MRAGGRRRRNTGKVTGTQGRGVAGRVRRVRSGEHCLPREGTDLRCCIEHALCRGDHR